MSELKSMLTQGAPVRSWRDTVAHWLTNWILNHIATPWYRNMIVGVTYYGLNSAVRDIKENREAPPMLDELKT